MSKYHTNWAHEERRRGDYMRTRSGIKFYPLDPAPSDFNIEDTASGLSNMPRWGGQCDFYSVAEHAVHCASAALALKLPNVDPFKMLHHDDSEGYMADLTRPLKSGLPDYKRVEANLMRAASFAYRFAWPLTPEEHELDSAMMVAESRFLFPKTTLLDFPEEPRIVLPTLRTRWSPDEAINHYRYFHNLLKP